MQPNFSHWVDLLDPLYPYASVILALLIGWRFDRSRLVFATVVISLAAWALTSFSADARLGAVVALLLPLNLGLIALLKERGLFTWHGIIRWLFILGQPLLLWLLERSDHMAWLEPIDHPLLPLEALAKLPLPQGALLMFILTLGITAWFGIRQHNSLENGLFWTTALLLYSLLAVHNEATLLVLCATALIVLTIAVLEVSHAMAFRDELTGLPGRRALNQSLLKLGSRYSVAMVDVDHFKKFNDRYGHDAGDDVLKAVAGKLAQVRGGGKAFRYGGEEFTVLFPGKELDEALPNLEELREEIATYNFVVRNKKRPKNKPVNVTQSQGTAVNITVSIGVAERIAEKDPNEVIKAADKALYKAKKGGRNRIAK